ncbi:MAG: alpha-1,4 polygalactosaminidase, partial [Planctomycetes bacterium]|nr:alpha-1,4 polygalactosaminidase [Planctomycetota bacterium]
NLVRTIPAGEIITRTNTLTEPPDSLLQAMRIFFLGVAAGRLVDGGGGNRSMMVHPSQQTMLHGDYCRWVNEAKARWVQLLGLPQGDPDRLELIDELRDSHADLQATVANLRPLDELLSVLAWSIRRTRVWEVNTAGGPTPEIDWGTDYSHVLVGGQAMDRGFTVNGLTVTYMPRGVGTGTADTIQQRARFFGYKRLYLGYCRIYLEAAARAAYQSYVEHEENLRQRLTEHRRTGRPLTDWKRAFFLDQQLQPTRRSVMDLTYLHDVLSDEWYVTRAPHDSEEAVVTNREIVRRFLERLTLQPDAGSPQRTEMQQHHLADEVPLSLALADLLTPMRITRAQDSQRYTGLLLQVREYLDAHPAALCRVYTMSRGAERERSVDREDEIPMLRLFQGAHPVFPLTQRGAIYPGDSEMRAPTGLTIQVHRLRVVRADDSVLDDVPALAVWVPSEMAEAWVVQEPPR